MALINCPECGRNNVSDSAKTCPGCGYPIKDKALSNAVTKHNSKPIVFAIIAISLIIFIILIVTVLKRDDDPSDFYTGYNNYSSDSNYSSYKSKTTDSSIFSNLDIKDFSCSYGEHSGTLQCKVTNNNSFSVMGYFRVNFYDDNGSLMHSELTNLPDVASGETVVCSTTISKADYPFGYSTVDFSQASLTESY